MKIISTQLPGVLLVTPAVFNDNRGAFLETYSAQRYHAAGITLPFVQDNVSYSKKNVLRGLHYQLQHPQGKLVHVLKGKIFDVAIDIRRGSATFCHWFGVELSDANHEQLYIPPGFAHGFLALSDEVIVHYKCTAYYVPQDDYGICWNDATLAITWPIVSNLIISAKDSNFLSLNNIMPDLLPIYSEI